MLEPNSKPIAPVDIERIIQLRTELDTLERTGREGANEQLAATVSEINTLIEKAELIARTFKLDFMIRGNNAQFYGNPEDLDNEEPGWLSSSDFC